jgi:hypothetical protein
MATVAPRYPLQTSDGGGGYAATAAKLLFAAQSITETAAATNIGGNRPLRNYLTDLVLSNSAGTAAIVTILDGSTVIGSFWVAGSSAPYSVNLSSALRGSPNTAMNIQSSSASAIIFYTATGYAAQ